MIVKMFSVYDSMANAYLQPFFSPARGLAIRSFSEAVNTSDHQFHKYAGDFTLFEIGEFDDEKGCCCTYEAYHRIGSGTEFLDTVVSGGPAPVSRSEDSVNSEDDPVLLRAMGDES